MAFPKTKGPYKIKRGDTLSGIAKKYKTTVASIMKMNPGIKDKDKIRAGAGIRVGGTFQTPADKSKAARGKKDFKALTTVTERQKKRRAALKKFGNKTQVAGKRRGGVMKAAGGKMAKGYSKGGARRMMTAMGGKMAKGMRRGGVKTAMGGRMMAKGYSKGGARILKASAGMRVRAGRGTTGDKKPNMSAQTLKKIYNMARKNSTGDRMTVTDINKALRMFKK